MTKKNVSKKNVSKKSMNKLAVVSGGIAPAPSSSAPRPPAGYTPKAGVLKNRPRIPHALMAMAAGVVTELRRSSQYAEDFGKNAPSSSDLADRVEATSAWSTEIEPALSWLAYVKDEASRGWQGTVQRLYELEPAFTYANERDPSIAERYPTLAALFALPKAAGRRGAVTRAAKRKKLQPSQSQAQQQGASASATTSATPASPNDSAAPAAAVH